MTALRSLARRRNGSINAKIAGETVQKCVPAPGPCVMSGPCAETVPLCGWTRPFFARGRYNRLAAFRFYPMTAGRRKVVKMNLRSTPRENITLGRGALLYVKQGNASGLLLCLGFLHGPALALRIGNFLACFRA